MIRFFAYVDPSTGSFALQAAVGAVMGASFMLRSRVRGLLNKFRKPKAGKPNEAE